LKLIDALWESRMTPKDNTRISPYVLVYGCLNVPYVLTPFSFWILGGYHFPFMTFSPPIKFLGHVSYTSFTPLFVLSCLPYLAISIILMDLFLFPFSFSSDSTLSLFFLSWTHRLALDYFSTSHKSSERSQYLVISFILDSQTHRLTNLHFHLKTSTLTPRHDVSPSFTFLESH
jgi:hypothetical protein